MKLQIKLPAALQAAMTRFDAMSLRERVLIGGALLATVWVLWDTALMQPLNARQAALVALLDNPESAAIGIDTAPVDPSTTDATATDGSIAVTDPDPIGTALLQRESLQVQLASVNQQLKQVSAELIAPERMSEVLYDVLRQQHNLALISLHNKPVSSLVPAAKTQPSDATIGMPDGGAQQPLGPGPYQHPVELVIEGRYLDIVDYLRALEALPWHFHWQALELDGKAYPLNRVRIELSTLSLDPAWIGT